MPSSSSASISDSIPSSPSIENPIAQQNVDLLFDRGPDKFSWEPPAPPEALGELLDSRHMLPLYLPTDPRLLGAIPGKKPFVDDDGRFDATNPNRAPSRASQRSRGAVTWRLQSSRLREVGIRTLQFIDGASSTARWYRPVEDAEADEGGEGTDADQETPPPPYTAYDPDSVLTDEPMKVVTHLTPLTRARSTRSRGKASVDATPVEVSEDGVVQR